MAKFNFIFSCEVNKIYLMALLKKVFTTFLSSYILFFAFVKTHSPLLGCCVFSHNLKLYKTTFHIPWGGILLHGLYSINVMLYRLTLQLISILTTNWIQILLKERNLTSNLIEFGFSFGSLVVCNSSSLALVRGRINGHLESKVET